MDSVTYRWFRDGDESGLLALLQAAFGRWPGVDVPCEPIEHLRWKLRMGGSTTTLHTVAEADGRIVAGQLLSVQPYASRGQPLSILRGWDSAVHPDYRGRGIMREMREFARASVPEDCLMHFGAFTRNPAMLRVHAREGRIAFNVKMETVIAPLTVRAAMETLRLYPTRAPGKLARSSVSFLRWAARAPGLGAGPGQYTVREVACFDERIDGFLPEATSPFDYALLRTREFLNWRYADARAGLFHIKLAELGGRIAGYTVLRETGGRAYLADLMALPEHLEAVRALARAAMAHFRRAGASRVECLIAANHPYRKPLASAGFVGRRRRKTPLTFQPLHATPEQIASLSDADLRIHLMVGDSDIV